MVFGLDRFLACLVIGFIGLGVFDHLLNLSLGQTRATRDRDLLLFAGAFVACRDVDDTVGVDVERDFDLWHPARRWGNTVEVEAAQDLVVASHLALALRDHHFDRRLTIRCRRERLSLLGRDGGVARDHSRHHAT